MAAHNQQFAIEAEQEGSAFVADAMGAWREILCVQEDRTVGNDNTVKWQRLTLQLPAKPVACALCQVMCGCMSIRTESWRFIGDHRLADYGADGVLIQPDRALLRATPSSTPGEIVTRRRPIA